MANKNNILAVASLATGAMVWGLIWFPYRALEDAGMGGALASFLTYGLALLPGAWLFRHRVGQFGRSPWLLAAIAVAAGWCNLAYVLATLGGEVMQVLLLFYLAPLWTIGFARLILGEKPGRAGALVVALAVCGAIVMLWRPGMRLPVPRDGAEWLGLSAGMAFALSNVLSRRTEQIDEAVKSLSVWAGVFMVSLPVAIMTEQPVQAAAGLGLQSLLLVALVAVVIFAINLVVQHGLTHTPANRAIVIFLSELVFAALAAHFLEFEEMDWRQWAGGSLVVAAALLSGRLESTAENSARA